MRQPHFKVVSRAGNAAALVAAAALLALLGLVSRPAFALDVALAPSSGEATKPKLDSLDQALAQGLAGMGHTVRSPAETAQAMKALALSGVEMLKDAEQLGTKLPVEFVVAARLTALAGQDSIEIRAYWLAEGRVELLEEIAADGEMTVIVAGMVQRLVTREGLSGPKSGKSKAEVEVAAPQPQPPSSLPLPMQETKAVAEVEDSDDDDEEERLLASFQPPAANQEKKKVPYGAAYQLSLQLFAGPTVMLTTPVKGSRPGGVVTIALGYVVAPVYGCEVGGELRALFGTGDAFSVAAFAAVNFPLTPRFPVYAGGRFSLGYFRGISGGRRNQMLMRAAGNLTVTLAERYMLILSPVAFTLLFFDGSPVVFYEAGLGFGFRF